MRSISVILSARICFISWLVSGWSYVSQKFVVVIVSRNKNKQN